MAETRWHRLPASPVITDVVKEVLIVACTESTIDLETALLEEGFACRVLRQQAGDRPQGFSHSYLCLLNHCNAWREVVKQQRLTLIVEADFVPVAGMGQLPISFPKGQSDFGIAWLYTCAPQIYTVSPEGYAEGFATSMAAYVIGPKAASILLEFAQQITETIGPHQYSSWDSEVEGVLRSHQLRNYVPFRNYGEHGGIPNPEHLLHNLTITHRADVLYGKLAFLPMYATKVSGNPHVNFWLMRSYARLRGWGRLVCGRFLRWKIFCHSTVPWQLLKFALLRQFVLHMKPLKNPHPLRHHLPLSCPPPESLR